LFLVVALGVAASRMVGQPGNSESGDTCSPRHLLHIDRVPSACPGVTVCLTSVESPNAAVAFQALQSPNSSPRSFLRSAGDLEARAASVPSRTLGAVQRGALADRCTADPGPFQAVESGTIPVLQRTTKGCRAAAGTSVKQASKSQHQSSITGPLPVTTRAAWTRTRSSIAVNHPRILPSRTGTYPITIRSLANVLVAIRSRQA
jgi:hypothetical protein